MPIVTHNKDVSFVFQYIPTFLFPTVFADNLINKTAG